MRATWSRYEPLPEGRVAAWWRRLLRRPRPLVKVTLDAPPPRVVTEREVLPSGNVLYRVRVYQEAPPWGWVHDTANAVAVTGRSDAG